jgi:hypothetical protein
MALKKPRKVVQWLQVAAAGRALDCDPVGSKMPILGCQTVRRILPLGLLALCFSSSAAATTHAQEPAAAEPTPALPEPTAEVAELIRQLDDDRFAVREAAQYKLVAQGEAALGAVGAAAGGGSLESSTRAVGILLQWAQSPDAAMSLGALEQLAGLANRPAEAEMATQRLADVREAAALEKIVNLGGKVPSDPIAAVVVGPALPLQIIIGPKWTGGAEGLSHIADVPRATTLSFHSAPLGDEAVPSITKLDSLQRIEFYGTNVSPEAVELVKRQLPHAVVDVRGPARLGIAGLPGVGGAAVQQVQPGSAAERADIRPGDVITEISGVPVNNFEALTAEISNAQLGEGVVLKVLRPGAPAAETLDITVKFDRWGEEAAASSATPVPAQAQPLGAVPLGAPQRVIINRR